MLSAATIGMLKVSLPYVHKHTLHVSINVQIGVASELVSQFPFKPQSYVARIKCGNVEESWLEFEWKRSGRKPTHHRGDRAL